MTTAYLTHPSHIAHHMADHPERADRLLAVEAALAGAALDSRLQRIDAEPAEEADLRRVHTADYLALLADVARRQRHVLFGADTYAGPESYAIARLAAGGAIQAVDRVLGGEARNAMVAVRPPGHHALPDRAMGFCLLANVALAVRYAQAVLDVERIAIVDYDVHHGNGTQGVFYEDPGVLFVSTHQSPFYPGTGALEEVGSGAGAGTTVNVPLRAGYGDAAYARVFEAVVTPAVRRFRPELILVSAGFDAHWDDPLGGMNLTLAGYDCLSRDLIRLADELCEGRIVFVLEGGYSLPAVAHGVLNVVYALLGDATVSDPLGEIPADHLEAMSRLPAISELIETVRRLHGLAG
jgi:acetoin utilization deacetylase AcuC-like enzyme